MQPTARSSRFGGVEIRKNYWPAGGSAAVLEYTLFLPVVYGARIKRSMRPPVFYRLTPNTPPGRQIFLLYGQYLNLPVANTTTGNQYPLYRYFPTFPGSSPPLLGRSIFYKRVIYIQYIVYLYILYTIYCIFYYIYSIFSTTSPPSPVFLISLSLIHI